MPKRTLSFAAYSDTGTSVAWGPANSNPAFPSGYTLGGDPARIASGRFGKFSGSGNTVILDDTVLTGNVIAVEAILGPVTSDSQCLVLCNPSGTGYQFLINSTNIRCFAMTNFVLGAQVGSPIAFVATGGHTARVARNNTNGDMVVSTGVDEANQTTRGTINQANVNTDWRAGVAARNSASIASLVSDYTAAQSIDTFTDPIVPGAAASGTQTGFTNGAITANFGGLTFTGTVSGSAVSGTMSSFVDGGLCPLLPAASVSGTFTQSGNTASITRAISVPTGLRELRDGSNNPANFAGLVTDDPKYLGKAFADAGNPLTTSDRAYWDPAYGLLIDQDGRIRLNGTDHPTDPVPSLPYVTTIWIWRGADGRSYEHELTIDEAGNVIVGGISAIGLSVTGLTITGLTARGL